MKSTIAAGPPWVGGPSHPAPATLANERALGFPTFGSTPLERAVLRDLRAAAAEARAARKALKLARVK